MSFRDFTLSKIESQFRIYHKRVNLFENTDIDLVQPSQKLLDDLEDAKMFSLTTEKVKSEAIVFPILVEVKRRNKNSISLFSGEILDIDKEIGLNGEIDFIITGNPDSLEVNSPIISVIEAKRDSADLGIAQCAAQLVGMSYFNKNNSHIIEPLYGCVTDAESWLFLKLEGNMISVDSKKYFINELPIVLGVFQMIVNNSKK